MKKSTFRLFTVLPVVAFATAVHGLEPGESVYAKFLPGAQPGTSLGNPNDEGQGWFLRDMTTPLNYYDDGNGAVRWANAEARPEGYWGRYSDVNTNSAGDITLRDAYWASIGVAWVYTNNAFGKYALSFDEMRIGSYLRMQVKARENADAEWTQMSEIFDQNQTLYNLAFTNTLGNGGAIALVVWNSGAMVSDAGGSVKGLKATFIERAVDTSRVSLSATPATLHENMFLQPAPANVVVTAKLSEPSTRDTAVHFAFGGAAVKDTHYCADAQSLVIPAGMTEAALTLTAIDDASADGDKDIIVSIASLENAEPAETQSVKITLLDDDMPLSKNGDVCMASVFWGGEEDTATDNPNPSGQAWYRKNFTTPLNAYFAGTATSKWATAYVNAAPSYSHVVQETPTTLRIVDHYYGALGIGWVYTATEPGLYVLSCNNISGSYIRTQFLAKTGGDAWQDVSGAMGALASGYAVTNWLNTGDALAIRIHNTNGAVATMNALVDTLKVTLLKTHEKQTLLILR